MYERTLLCNNRNLALALEKMRGERLALQNQILDLNQKKLEVEIDLNHANCRLSEVSKLDNFKARNTLTMKWSCMSLIPDLKRTFSNYNNLKNRHFK